MSIQPIIEAACYAAITYEYFARQGYNPKTTRILHPENHPIKVGAQGYFYVEAPMYTAEGKPFGTEAIKLHFFSFRPVLPKAVFWNYSRVSNTLSVGPLVDIP